MNKERQGKTIRFSIRMPKEQHKWLKEKSFKTKGEKKFFSMNDYICIAVEKMMKEESDKNKSR